MEAGSRVRTRSSLTGGLSGLGAGLSRRQTGIHAYFHVYPRIWR